jgi:hypothetical protein
MGLTQRLVIALIVRSTLREWTNVVANGGHLVDPTLQAFRAEGLGLEELPSQPL